MSDMSADDTEQQLLAALAMQDTSLDLSKEYIAYAGKDKPDDEPAATKDDVIIVNMSGRGDKDIFITAPVFNKQEWVEFLSNEIKN